MNTLIIILGLAALACTLQAAPAKLAATPSQTPAPVATPAPTAVIQRITTKTTTPSPTSTPAPTVCKVKAEALNVRACPGVSWAVVAWLNAGETITTTQPITAWVYTQAGWINSNFLECAK